MRTIVEEGKNIFTALGDRRRTVSAAEMEKRKKFRRSLVARRKLEKGHTLAEADLDAKRPGTGSRAKRNILCHRAATGLLTSPLTKYFIGNTCSDREEANLDQRTLDLPLIVIGGGGHAKVLISTLLLQRRRVLGFVDVKQSLPPLLNVTHLGDDDAVFHSFARPGAAGKWYGFDRFHGFAQDSLRKIPREAICF